MKKLAERCAGILLVGAMCVSAGAKTHKPHKPHKAKNLKAEIARLLDDPMAARAHWGIDVTTMDGKPIYSFNDGQLFRPASNNKIFTTATAMALLGGNTTFQTKVIARGIRQGADRLTGDLILVGAGDSNISGRPIPYVAPALRPNPAPPAPPALRYLEDMADQIAKTGLKVVNGDIVGDDTLFPWDPYPHAWTIDDTVWGYGAPVSALTINDNQLNLTVTPGDAPGHPATVTIDPAIPYYTVDVSALMTGPAKSGNHVQIDRALGSKILRVYGSIAVDAKPDEEEIAIQDPAEYAAIALKQMLEQRGIVITGKARAEHRPNTDDQGLLTQADVPIPGFDATRTYGLGNRPDPVAKGGTVVATHTSIPVREDIVVTAKVSQNLHAELFLHQLGESVLGNGSTAQGARVVRAFLLNAGLDRDDFTFFDGSGLGRQDLVAPRATARFLLYASKQPWFADWKAALPVGGEDGTLARRFSKPPIKDHLFAKTGTLGIDRALSGYLDCASGRTVIFSIMVDTHPHRGHADLDTMDKIVEAIAAAN